MRTDRRNGGLDGKPVDLVLSCVDNFEARMAINMVSYAFISNQKFELVIDAYKNIYNQTIGLQRIKSNVDRIGCKRECSFWTYSSCHSWTNFLLCGKSSIS